jgi:hypothetical protein
MSCATALVANLNIVHLGSMTWYITCRRRTGIGLDPEQPERFHLLQVPSEGGVFSPTMIAKLAIARGYQN